MKYLVAYRIIASTEAGVADYWNLRLGNGWWAYEYNMGSLSVATALRESLSHAHPALMFAIFAHTGPVDRYENLLPIAKGQVKLV